MFKKVNKLGWLAAVTFSVLICLVVIQVLFLVKAGKLDQKHFNHRVVLALREARNEIAREANMCNYMRNYVCGNQCSSEMQYINFQKVDSIIQSNLYIHKINLDYRFEFVNESEAKQGKICVSCYEQSLNGLLAQNGIKLLIEFPEQSKFLFAQVGLLFYLSVMAIVFVMVSFIITFRLFGKNKAMLINTKGFIDNMAHEFQTPIANIKFASGLIKKRIGSGDAKSLEFASLIIHESKKMVSHVEDILKVAAMNNLYQKTEEVDLNEVVKDCVSEMSSLLKEQKVIVKLNLQASNSIIRGEYTYLKHAVSNLLDNALKYSDEHKLCLTISSKNKKNKLFISFADNGIGIPRKEFKNIFEKYYRISTGDIHTTKGFGLGLDFVKNVVRNHKGEIGVQSELNKGSIFTLKFNCKQKI